VVLYVIGVNATFGVWFDYLYWRFGLEAAMIAHMIDHLVSHVAGIVRVESGMTLQSIRLLGQSEGDPALEPGCVRAT